MVSIKSMMTALADAARSVYEYTDKLTLLGIVDKELETSYVVSADALYDNSGSRNSSSIYADKVLYSDRVIESVFDGDSRYRLVKTIKGGALGGVQIDSLPQALEKLESRSLAYCIVDGSLEFPLSVHSLGFDTLKGVQGLTQLTLTPSISSIPDYFCMVYDEYITYKCSSLPGQVTDLSLPAMLSGLDVPTGVEEIGANAFMNTINGGINLPATLHSVGDYAFYGCDLFSLSLPGQLVDGASTSSFTAGTASTFNVEPGVTVIPDLGSAVALNIPDTASQIYGPRAVENISGFDPDKYLNISGGIFDGWHIKDLVLGSKIIKPGHITLPITETLTLSNDRQGTFYENEALLSVNLKDKVTKVHDDMFRDCTNLQSVNTEVPIVSVGDHAFEHCGNLEDIDFIGAHCLHIGDYAFTGCAKIPLATSLMSLKYLGEGAFQDCTSLTTFRLSPELIAVKRNCFSGCTSLSSVSIPPSIEYICRSAFEGCTNLSKVELSTNAKLVDFNAFAGCTNLRSAVVGKVIKMSAFEGCTSLAHVEFTPGTEYIGDLAFKDCTALTDVVLPADIPTVGRQAFYNCTSLSSIDLRKDKLTKIYGEAFRGSGLSGKLVIPENIKLVAEYAFADCLGITEVEIFPEQIIATTAFSGCTNIKKIVIHSSSDVEYPGFPWGAPKGAVLVFDDAIAPSEPTETFECPENVLKVPAHAFHNSDIRKVVLHSAVEEVGDYAFYGSAMEELELLGVADEGDDTPEPAALSDDGSPEGAEGEEGVTEEEEVIDPLVLGSYMCRNAGNLTRVSVQRRIAEIPESMCAGCSALTEVTVEDSVTRIGDRAFADCSELTVIPNEAHISYIGVGAFANSGVTEISLGLSAEEGEESTDVEIGSAAFYGCTKLRSVTLGDRVKAIPELAFAGESELTEISIPSSVSTIGRTAFIGSSISKITVDNSSENVGEHAPWGAKSPVTCVFTNTEMVFE